jgi:hypothetical protein
MNRLALTFYTSLNIFLDVIHKTMLYDHEALPDSLRFSWLQTVGLFITVFNYMEEYTHRPMHRPRFVSKI